MNVLVEVAIEYLSGQADALQIFDTWAGSLPDEAELRADRLLVSM